MKLKIQLLLLSVGLLPIHVSADCSIDTGGYCTLFACGTSRHAECVKNAFGQGTCQCRPGSCAVNGVCRIHITQKPCRFSDKKSAHVMEWNMGHTEMNMMKETWGAGKHPVCVFRKTTGKQESYDATAISNVPEIASITFRAPGIPAVRIVGLTTDPNDDDNFEHGGFIKFDERGRVLTPSMGSILHPDTDYFTLTVSDPVGQKLEAFINEKSLGTFQAPSPIHGKTMYAKMFIQNIGAQIVILNITRMRNCEPCEHWGDWKYAATCGPHVLRTRERCILKKAIGNGLPCKTKETEYVDHGCCPVPCVLSEWTKWGPCSVTCCYPGDDCGHRERTRYVEHNAICGGTCPKERSETSKCPDKVCPARDCKWCPWKDWGTCAKASGQPCHCGWGHQERGRDICVEAKFGGKDCKGPMKQGQACSLGDCEKVDCKWFDWQPWSDCSVIDGQCSRTRERVLNLPSYEEASPRCLDEQTHLEGCASGSCEEHHHHDHHSGKHGKGLSLSQVSDQADSSLSQTSDQGGVGAIFAASIAMGIVVLAIMKPCFRGFNMERNRLLEQPLI